MDRRRIAGGATVALLALVAIDQQGSRGLANVVVHRDASADRRETTGLVCLDKGSANDRLL